MPLSTIIFVVIYIVVNFLICDMDFRIFLNYHYQEHKKISEHYTLKFFEDLFATNYKIFVYKRRLCIRTHCAYLGLKCFFETTWACTASLMSNHSYKLSLVIMTKEGTF